MKKKVLCIMLSLALLSAIMPTFAFADAPAGFNANEYEKLHAFLETEDENGVKNGFKISDEYVADDPLRWGTYYDYIEEDEYDCFLWEEIGGEMRITKVNCSWLDLVGELDLSDFTELTQVDCANNRLTALNVANCPELRELEFRMNPMHGSLDLSGSPLLYGVWAWETGLTGLDLTGCAELELLYLEDNPELGSLDISSCAKLDTLMASNCGLTEIDLSGCPMLVNVDLRENDLTEIDVTDNPELLGGHMYVEGEGSICYCWFSWNEGFVSINDPYAENFIGWFDGEGALITTESGIDLPGTDYTELVARFGDVVPLLGDADANGVINANDALAVLRFDLGMISVLPSGVNCDVDGNGIINANDALYILRYALGVISEFPAGR